MTNLKEIERNGLEEALNLPVSQMELHIIVILKKLFTFITVKTKIGIWQVQNISRRMMGSTILESKLQVSNRILNPSIERINKSFFYKISYVEFRLDKLSGIWNEANGNNPSYRLDATVTITKL